MSTFEERVKEARTQAAVGRPIDLRVKCIELAVATTQPAAQGAGESANEHVYENGTKLIVARAAAFEAYALEGKST